jgi:hypothetical protein
VKDLLDVINTLEGKYEGDLLNNKAEGFGKLTDKFGNLIYEGEFSNNQLNGQGILYNAVRQSENDWVIYEGEFKDNKRNGIGKMTFASNDIYFGQFANNSIYGFGTFYRNGVTTVGIWNDGSLEKAFH